MTSMTKLLLFGCLCVGALSPLRASDAEMAVLRSHLTQPITRDYETHTERSRFTWVFFGDSITSGVVHTHGARSFTEIFRNRLCGELGHSFDTVINSGFSGCDTLTLLDRDVYSSHVRFYRPEAVVVMLGANDARGVRNISRADFKRNIAKIVDMIRADKAIPILMTNNTIEYYKIPDGKPLDDYYQSYITLYNNLPSFMEAIREVAREKQVILVDNFANWQKIAADQEKLGSLLGETIHPGSLGHVEIAAELCRVLGIYDPGAGSFLHRSLGAPARSDR